MKKKKYLKENRGNEQMSSKKMGGSITERLKPEGDLVIILKDKNGNVKDKRDIKNLVVTSGKDFIAACFGQDPGPERMSHMAVGTSTVTPDVSDASLGSEISREPLVSTTVNANIVTFSANFPAGSGTGAITEACIISDTSPSEMLCRTTFSVVNKEADDSITINWNVAIT